MKLHSHIEISCGEVFKVSSSPQNGESRNKLCNGALQNSSGRDETWNKTSSLCYYILDSLNLNIKYDLT